MNLILEINNFGYNLDETEAGGSRTTIVMVTHN